VRAPPLVTGSASAWTVRLIQRFAPEGPLSHPDHTGMASNPSPVGDPANAALMRPGFSRIQRRVRFAVAASQAEPNKATSATRTLGICSGDAVASSIEGRLDV